MRHFLMDSDIGIISLRAYLQNYKACSFAPYTQVKYTHARSRTINLWIFASSPDPDFTLPHRRVSNEVYA